MPEVESWTRQRTYVLLFAEIVVGMIALLTSSIGKYSTICRRVDNACKPKSKDRTGREAHPLQTTRGRALSVVSPRRNQERATSLSGFPVSEHIAQPSEAMDEGYM